MDLSSRMRGSALEACLRELVLAAKEKRRPQVPLKFYFRRSENVPGGMLERPDILREMFALVR